MKFDKSRRQWFRQRGSRCREWVRVEDMQTRKPVLWDHRLDTCSRPRTVKIEYIPTSAHSYIQQRTQTREIIVPTLAGCECEENSSISEEMIWQTGSGATESDLVLLRLQKPVPF